MSGDAAYQRGLGWFVEFFLRKNQHRQSANKMRTARESDVPTEHRRNKNILREITLTAAIFLWRPCDRGVMDCTIAVAT